MKRFPYGYVVPVNILSAWASWLLSEILIESHATRWMVVVLTLTILNVAIWRAIKAEAKRRRMSPIGKL